jgi:20S proteasome subunit beta 1
VRVCGPTDRIESISIELNSEPKVHTAAVLFQDIIYQNKDRLMAGIIVGGYDKKNGGQVYSITLGGTMVCVCLSDHQTISMA